MQTLTVDLLLGAYAMGLFPMAEDFDDPAIHWVEPRRRGILPLDGLHVARSLRKALRRGRIELKVDQAFAEVVRACATPAPDRPQTWLNPELIALYVELHERGHAHSVEAWCQGELVGGLYGVHLGGAFFGESMFSRMTDASKMALVELVARLRAGGFALLDTQFITGHLESLGAIEISRADYLARLRRALPAPCRFPLAPYPFWPDLAGGTGRPGSNGGGEAGGGEDGPSGAGSASGSSQPITQTS